MPDSSFGSRPRNAWPSTGGSCALAGPVRGSRPACGPRRKSASGTARSAPWRKPASTSWSSAGVTTTARSARSSASRASSSDLIELELEPPRTDELEHRSSKCDGGRCTRRVWCLHHRLPPRYVAHPHPDVRHALDVRPREVEELHACLRVLWLDLDANPWSAVVGPTLERTQGLVAARARGHDRSFASEETNVRLARDRNGRRLVRSLLHDHEGDLDEAGPHLVRKPRKAEDLSISHRRGVHARTLEMLVTLVVAQHEELVNKPAGGVRADALNVPDPGLRVDARLIHDVRLDLDRCDLTRAGDGCRGHGNAVMLVGRGDRSRP